MQQRTPGRADTRTADERLRQLLESAPEILTYRYRLVPEPGLEHISASVEVIGGYPVEDCLADPNFIFSVVHPDDIGPLQAAIAEPESATGPFCLRWRRADGEWRRLEAHHSIVRDDAGRVVAMEGVALDVTERYRLADRLLEAQAVAHLGSWEWDVGTDRILWSDELYRLFGLNPEEFAATYEAYLDRVHPEDRPMAEANVARTVKTHQPFAADYRIIRPDGEVRWLRSHGRVAWGDGGEVRLIGTCQDITEQKLLEHALSHQALHDHLTDLPNRLLLADRLELALSRAARHDDEVGVFFVDLDGFKGVNDRFGHDGGDTVLRAVARRLADAVRPSDTVARYGGDEFVAVCEEISNEDAVHLARRISAAASKPVDLDGEEVCLTASVGLAWGGMAGDADLLIRDADAAMYRAKVAGGGGVEVAPRRVT
jgi:diguanylate cyclase (GGDEF)-like protein/PAS domain S-box-containing protein